MKTLETYGWNSERAADWMHSNDTEALPGRVISDRGQYFKVALPSEVSAQLAGVMIHKLKSTDLPKIGDWVAVKVRDDNTATIHSILPRTSEIVRGQVGRQIDKQVIAANVDLAFIVQPLDHGFSPERLERYIFQLASQNIKTVILLNKADKAHDIDAKKAQLVDLAADVVVMSAREDSDLSAVEHYITSGKTAVIMGSSGAGKSTLTNRLLGKEVQATAAIREKDSKGRHTTVHRELFVLPGGGMIIDTPGVRELQLWGSVKDLEHLFSEIFTAARSCRYTNCTHVTEDECQIKIGLVSNTISLKRYRMYQGFKQELETLANRQAFITERRSQQTKESAMRRLKRRRINEQNQSDQYE